MNNPSIPANFTNGPKNPGPNIDDATERKEYNAIALTMWDFLTRFGNIACRDGMSNESKNPVASDIVSNCHGVMRSEIISPAVRNANIAKHARLIITNLRRLILSAKTPPHTDKTIVGPKAVIVTNPSRISESVRSFINHNLAWIKVHIPMFEKAPPNQKKV